MRGGKPLEARRSRALPSRIPGRVWAGARTVVAARAPPASTGCAPVPDARARVDHDRHILGLEPRWPDPQLPHPHRPMVFAPAGLPAVRDLLDGHALHRRPIGIPRKPHAVGAVLLLEPLRKPFQHLKERGVRPVRLHPQRVAPHRNAARKRPKKPLSLAYVVSSTVVSNCCRSERCSSLRRRGTSTFTTTR